MRSGSKTALRRAPLVKAALAAVVLLGILLAVLVGRALLLTPPADPDGAAGSAAARRDGPAADGLVPLPDDAQLAEHLAAAVRLPTISHQDAAADDAAAFAALLDLLRRIYGRVFDAMAPEVVSERSLLLHWRGTDPQAKPLILLSHLDVVPVSPGTEGDWTQPPFSGRIDGGFVWGRGTLDDKSGVIGLLEAAELLLARGYAPRRDVYFAFGADEEVGGRRGAQQIAAILAATFAARGTEAEFVLDEGGVVTRGIVDGVAAPVAMIGVAEKGFLSVRLSVTVAGGHSSTPPRNTAIGTLTRALAAIEASPMAARIDGAVEGTLVALAPHMDFGRRLAIGNLWLLRPLVLHLLQGSDTGRASVRTTIAPTLFQSGDKDNVLPGRAMAVVNLRLLPGDSVEAALAHLRRAVADPAVLIEPLPGALASSPVSDAAAPAFKLLTRTVRETLPDALSAPYLTIGGTDATHYTALSRNVYRFMPARFGPDDMARFHGTNERIAVANFGEMVRFYLQLLRNAAA